MLAAGMDRRMKPVHIRQESTSDSPRAPSSPMNMSPLHRRHVRTGSTGMPNMKKAQTKAAAQRLAQVMSHQTDDGDDDDELSFDYTPSGFGSIGLAGGRRMRAKSPLVMQLFSWIGCRVSEVIQFFFVLVIQTKSKYVQ